MYCLALYGCCVWRLDSPNFSVIEIAFNKILRKIWNLPSHSHSSIVHCVANIPAIRNNIVHKHFFWFIDRCLSGLYPIPVTMLTIQLVLIFCMVILICVRIFQRRPLFIHHEFDLFAIFLVLCHLLKILFYLFPVHEHVTFHFFLSICTNVVCAISIIIIRDRVKNPI